MNMNGIRIISLRRARVLQAINRIQTGLPSILAIGIALTVVLLAAITAQPGILLGAAVTIVSRVTNVAGARKFREISMTGGNGDTLDTRMRRVRWVAFTPGTNTPTAAAQSTVGGFITLTFTTGGAFTAMLVVVCGN